MIYKSSLPDFKYSNFKPHEDSLIAIESVFAVADGITRDPIGIKNFTGKSKEDLLQSYPKPSGAKWAADLFCDKFAQFIIEKKNSVPIIKDAFIYANQAILELNKQHIKEVDYLVNDYFGCVAAGGIIKENKLYWGYITDCGVAIFDRRGNLKFRTPDDMAAFVNHTSKNPGDWSDPKRRQEVRSKFRNNPDQIVDDQCVAYGALTGEKTAEFFIKTGEQKIDNGDLVVFYTDGMADILSDKEFFPMVYGRKEEEIDRDFSEYVQQRAIKDYNKYGKEKTFIAVLNNS